MAVPQQASALGEYLHSVVGTPIDAGDPSACPDPPVLRLRERWAAEQRAPGVPRRRRPRLVITDTLHANNPRPAGGAPRPNCVPRWSTCAPSRMSPGWLGWATTCSSDAARRRPAGATRRRSSPTPRGGHRHCSPLRRPARLGGRHPPPLRPADRGVGRSGRRAGLEDEPAGAWPPRSAPPRTTGSASPARPRQGVRGRRQRRRRAARRRPGAGARRRPSSGPPSRPGARLTPARRNPPADARAARGRGGAARARRARRGPHRHRCRVFGACVTRRHLAGPRDLIDRLVGSGVAAAARRGSTSGSSSTAPTDTRRPWSSTSG